MVFIVDFINYVDQIGFLNFIEKSKICEKSIKAHPKKQDLKFKRAKFKFKILTPHFQQFSNGSKTTKKGPGQDRVFRHAR